MNVSPPVDEAPVSEMLTPLIVVAISGMTDSLPGALIKGDAVATVNDGVDAPVPATPDESVQLPAMTVTAASATTTFGDAVKVAE